MNKPVDSNLLSSPDAIGALAQQRVRGAAIGADTTRSATARASQIKPLYTRARLGPGAAPPTLGLPGQPPYTRGIYPPCTAAAPGRSAS